MHMFKLFYSAGTYVWQSFVLFHAYTLHQQFDFSHSHYTYTYICKLCTRHRYNVKRSVFAETIKVTTAVSVSDWPSQMSFSELKKNPLGHWQVKLPGVFLHRPFSHRSVFTMHSSISKEEGGRRCTCTYCNSSPSNGVRRPSSPPTNAVFPRQVHLIAFVARAFVGPQHVLTHAILADVGVEGTLVNIWEDTGRPWSITQWNKLWVMIVFQVRSKHRRMMSFGSLPLPSPVIPPPLGHRARYSAGGMKTHKVNREGEDITRQRITFSKIQQVQCEIFNTVLLSVHSAGFFDTAWCI